MKISNHVAYKRWDTSYEAVQFAKLWADLIEGEISGRQGNRITLNHEADFYKAASHTKPLALITYDVTPQTYNQALLFLAECWDHGIKLAEWSLIEEKKKNESLSRRSQPITMRIYRELSTNKPFMSN